jgi:GNAT superfamily N-acetyltransferase
MLTLTPLTEAGLPAFEALLGSRAFGGCFCAVWTDFGADWGRRCADPARPNLASTRARVVSGDHVGFLVHDGATVVAWTGAGPWAAFPGLATRKASRSVEDTDDAWALGCLAVHPDHRGRGVSTATIRAVREAAARAGARHLYAFPTDPWDEPRSYRGSLAGFVRQGFTEVLREPDGDSAIVAMRVAV